MLVLTRKTEQRILIGDGIEITVLEIRGGRVRLGITCPAEIPVHRKEVYERIAGERAEEDADACLLSAR